MYQYAPNPVAYIDPFGLIDPNDMWFTQNSISDVFTDGPWKGKSITEAIEENRRLKALPEGLKIYHENIIMPNDQEISATLNNRTLYVAQQAGLTNVDAINKNGKGLNQYNKLTDRKLPTPSTPEIKCKKC